MTCAVLSNRVAPILGLMLAFLGGACVESFEEEDAGTPVDKGGADGRHESGVQGDITLLEPVTLSGVVRAPEGKTPISGALVYATTKAPPAIPDTVYCDTCVELTPTTPYTTSGSDGKFTLKIPIAGKWILVTQKGAFRRVRSIDVKKTDKTIDEKLTTLPSKTDKSLGDTIPKMAVIQGAWDLIENSLAKLGLGQVNTAGKLKPGTESFTLHQCKLVSIWPPLSTCTPVHPGTLISDYTLLSQYQILFVPCASDWLDGYLTQPKVQANLVKWIKAGGRLYVTDYQYDALQQTLPGYITWENQSSTLGSAEMTSSYDAPAVVEDTGLKDWLSAQGVTTFDLLASYTVIKSVAKQITPNPDGKSSQYLVPYVWVSGLVPSYGKRPMTVSYSYGCGRVLFSTYHTEGDKTSGSTLLPQEKALLYIILEVAVCIKQPPPA